MDIINRIVYEKKGPQKNTFQTSPVSKIRNQSGESIAETLVALLVSVLALTMLAGAITSTSKIVDSSSRKMESYYSGNEDLIDFQSGATASSATISISETTSGSGEKLRPQSIDISCYINPEFSNHHVIRYKSN